MSSSAPSVRHWYSHSELLAIEPTPSKDSPHRVDAIIVPATRPPAHLIPAAELGENLGVPVVIFCSGYAYARSVSNYFANHPSGYRPLVIPLSSKFASPLMEFKSSRHPQATLWWKGNDVSTKRNLALMTARMCGWRNLAFFDDDVSALAPGMVSAASRLLADYEIVGLRSLDFPDNSVVCHANRATGGFQDVFISGGCMLVDTFRANSFFPEIYSEDWLFAYESVRRESAAAYRQIFNDPYDPFLSTTRAQREEFGDVVAEGLMAGLHVRLPAEALDTTYWQEFLNRRRTFITSILDRLSEADTPFAVQQIRNSLLVALARLDSITAEDCDEFVRLWRHDLHRWQQSLRRTPRFASVAASLRCLGLSTMDAKAQAKAAVTLAQLSDVSSAKETHLMTVDVGGSSPIEQEIKLQRRRRKSQETFAILIANNDSASEVDSGMLVDRLYDAGFSPVVLQFSASSDPKLTERIRGVLDHLRRFWIRNPDPLFVIVSAVAVGAESSLDELADVDVAIVTEGCILAGLVGGWPLKGTDEFIRPEDAVEQVVLMTIEAVDCMRANRQLRRMIKNVDVERFSYEIAEQIARDATRRMRSATPLTRLRQATDEWFKTRLMPAPSNLEFDCNNNTPPGWCNELNRFRSLAQCFANEDSDWSKMISDLSGLWTNAHVRPLILLVALREQLRKHLRQQFRALCSPEGLDDIATYEGWRKRLFSRSNLPSIADTDSLIRMTSAEIDRTRLTQVVSVDQIQNDEFNSFVNLLVLALRQDGPYSCQAVRKTVFRLLHQNSFDVHLAAHAGREMALRSGHISYASSFDELIAMATTSPHESLQLTG